MNHLLLTTIAAVVLVGCGPSVPDISIHEAARTGNIEAVKQHLAAGADVNAKDDSFGGTPLHYAAMEGHMEIVELLITKGADVNAKDGRGRTPLHSATTKKIAELLVAAGANVNAKGDGGWTPLHSGAIQGHKEIAELLIAGGADVNAKEDVGFTPLHRAAMYDQKAVVKLLISAGANLNSKSGLAIKAKTRSLGEQAAQNMMNYKTPLDIALSFANQDEIADLIRKHGGKTGEELKAEGN